MTPSRCERALSLPLGRLQTSGLVLGGVIKYRPTQRQPDYVTLRLRLLSISIGMRG